MKKDTSKFSYACKAFLMKLTIGPLRTYGRQLGVLNPTLKKKDELVGDMVAILSGEMSPTDKQKSGAPIKDVYVDPKILKEIQSLKERFLFDEEALSLTELFKNGAYIEVNDPSKDKMRNGTIGFGAKGCFLLPSKTGEGTLPVPQEVVAKYDLRDGDEVLCQTTDVSGFLTVSKIFTINGVDCGELSRLSFDEISVAFPSEKIKTISEELPERGFAAAKYFEWLLPLGKGQRALVCAPPKAGKSRLLTQFVSFATQNNPSLIVLALLIEQSPETVGEYMKIIPKENISYTTYGQKAEDNVIFADFLLNRAKRMSEMGKDVLLVVDSFTTLAKAYDETPEAAGGKRHASGMEIKTLHYIKKYFGSARCFQGSGSLAIVGTTTFGTGSAIDETVTNELIGVSNCCITLDEKLSAKRVYPAFDLLRSSTNEIDKLLSEEELKTEGFLRSQYVPQFGNERLIKWLELCPTAKTLYEKTKKEFDDFKS